ncbi:MAG: hypothetical protein K2N86_02960 [Rikenellaceae bacterium]|nr:hypothetical protein [Rikenellaceae bacterium]MDE7356753.1 hypothetical protein [Rikenellaceae bacterium]
MIDFLLSEYQFYSKEEEQSLNAGINDIKVVREHIGLLEKRQRRFKRSYAVSTAIIKIVPIAVLAVCLALPTYSKAALIAGFVVVVVSESLKSIFCPLRYFDSIARNILILKSIEKSDNLSAKPCNNK